MALPRSTVISTTQKQRSVRVPDLEPDQRYHVFVCHCQADLGFAKRLMKDLESRGLKCAFAGRDFLPGDIITENIIQAINNSRKVLMVYSKETKKSEWCTFEVILTLEKSIERDRCMFVPILLPDATIDDIPRSFARVTCIEMKGNPDYLDQVTLALSVPEPPIESQLPAGNVGHGLAWSFFYGYLNLILPDIDSRVKRSEWWDGSYCRRHMSYKYFVMLPDTCLCHETLTDEDANITHVGYLEDVVKSRAGTVGRCYRNTVYKVVHAGEEYYCVCEYATAVLVMHEMEVNQLAGLTAHDRKLQVERFHKTLESILVHGSIKGIRGKARIIRYQQNGKTRMSELLVAAIKEEIEKEIRVDQGIERLAEKCGSTADLSSIAQGGALPNNAFHVTRNGNFVHKMTGGLRNCASGEIVEPANSALENEKNCHKHDIESSRLSNKTVKSNNCVIRCWILLACVVCGVLGGADSLHAQKSRISKPLNLYLLVVDYYSEYIDVLELESETTSAVVKAMKAVFACLGIPDKLRSDNGPQNTSAEFRTFCENYGILQETSIPHFQSSNGEAERAI
ncbi:hypothetical protein ScPMuIL_010092 [Solemya velum]